MRVVHLHVCAEADGGWRLMMSEGGGAPISATVPPDQVAAAAARAKETLIPEPVLVPNHDLALVGAELQAGQALASALSTARVGELWQRTLGDTGAEGIALAVSAEDPEVAALPWELLTTSPQEDLLERRGGLVARLGHARPVGPIIEGRERLRLIVWCPSPENPTCGVVIRALEQLAESLGLEPPTRLDPTNPRLPPAREDVADVLHIVGHGVVAEEFAALRLNDTRLVAPGDAAELLSAALGRVALVVLDVCSGGSPSANPLRGMATQFLAQGAPAVLGPARPAIVQASLAFSQGLYGALARGASLVQSVREGRAKARALGMAHPSGRANNMLLFVGRLGALQAPPPVVQGWRPPGWPTLDPALRALMTRARAMAAREGKGYVGLEHLVRAWEPADKSPLAQRVAYRLRSQITEAQWAALGPAPWSTADPAPTPRLLRLLKDAPGPATVDDLWRAVALDPHHGLHALAGHSLAAHVAPYGSETPMLGGESPGLSAPAIGVEILWGPRDGERLVPAPGQTVGRGDQNEGPEVAISPPDAPWGDAHVSRRHLVWVGPGRAEARQQVTHYPAGQLDRLTARRGDLELRDGDLLKLGERTWLRAISRES